MRFRSSSGREKLQLQVWLLGALFAVALFIVALGVYVVSSYYGDGLFNASSAVVLCLPVVAAFAIVRHRLYDIDVVLNRALTYGLLTAIIAGAYAALVLGVGALASGHGTLLAATAAALCALAFAPLRAWLQRAVNRLLYGARHEPAAAVETLGRHLGETVDPADLLPTLVAVIARTLRLGYVAVELAEGDGFTRAAEVGTPADETHSGAARRPGRDGRPAGARRPAPGRDALRRGSPRARDALGAGGPRGARGAPERAARALARAARERARGGAPPPAPRSARRPRPDAGGGRHAARRGERAARPARGAAGAARASCRSRRARR